MKILNFGSLNLDYIYDVSHFVEPGETLATGDMEIFCGGKGFNQSLAVCKSGQGVWHAGALGESDSKMLMESFVENGVHTEFILKKSGSSGHAIIQRDRSGQNCILLYGGANQCITQSDVDHVLEAFEAGDYIILQNEISEVAYIMEKAHEKGMQIVFNPSPMNKQIENYPLEYVDYLILNEIEAKQICEMKLQKVTEDSKEQIQLLASYLPQAKVVLTLGDKGAIYKEKDKEIFQKAYKVQAIDTTGAGDTFTGFFIGSLAQGKEISEAMDLAAKASAISVTRKGAGPSIPSLKEVILFH